MNNNYLPHGTVKYCRGNDREVLCPQNTVLLEYLPKKVITVVVKNINMHTISLQHQSLQKK